MKWLDALAEVLSPSGADIGAKENVAVIKKVKGCHQFSDLHLILPNGRVYVCQGGELAGNGNFNFHSPYGASYREDLRVQSLNLEHLKSGIKDNLGVEIDNVVCEDGTSLEELNWERSERVVHAIVEKAKQKYG